MAYSFTVNQTACINCGICMDLCPIRCLDMTRPTSDGELAAATELLSPIPGEYSQRSWMMLTPVQTAPCIGCQVCAHECPTNAIAITSAATISAYAKAGPISHLPPETGWQPLNAYTRAVPDEPGETPWGTDHGWKVAERDATWQTWRTWLGDRTEDLRAPCQTACPVGTNAGLYVSLVAEGRYAEAFQVASEPNPFPSICGRVCTAPCEAVCRRGEIDAPIAIRDLKRFAGDHASHTPLPAQKSKHYYLQQVAIVGAGPTGLSAAYYLARRGYRVTVFDAMPVAGGMMAIGIPPYRLPRAELERDIDRITALGVTLRLSTAVGRDVSLDDLRHQFHAVLLAVGAQLSQELGIPGEKELVGVIPATTFLKDFNLDSTARLSGTVAVIGGGSTALDAARSALRAGATKVYILYRRTRAEMPAQVDEVRAALAEGIEILELVAPLSFAGADGALSQIQCQRMTLGEPDEKGRRRPIPLPGSEFDVPVTTALIAVGEAPDPSFLPPGTGVGVTEWGGLLVNPATLATGEKGVFAAGDVTYGPASVIEAAAHGRKAAKFIHAYLQHIPPARIHEMPDDENETHSTLPKDGAVAIDLTPTPRAEMSLRGTRDARTRDIEFASGLTEAQARREASRCLRCDLAYLCPSIKVASPTKVPDTVPAEYASAE